MGPFETWLLNLRIPWLVGGSRGMAFFGAIGQVLDEYLDRLKAAVKVRFPEYAPTDALGALGDERALDRGPTETDPGYATRLRQAWEQWVLASTPLGLLVALDYAGFGGAVVVQQNGRGYTLSGAPSLANPYPGLVVYELAAHFQLGHPWFVFDIGNEAFTSRFAVLFPPPTSINLSSSDELGRLQRVIAKWRPAKTTCVGIFVGTDIGGSGRFMEWPPMTFAALAASGLTFAQLELLSTPYPAG